MVELGATGVLYFPVVLTTVGAVTDDKHTMVELGATGAREDATGVVLESRLVSLDGYGDGSLLDGGHQIGAAVGFHVTDASNHAGLLAISGALLGGVAGSCLCGARVRGLELIPLGLEVLEAVVHQATVATLVAEGASAVDELLLRERDE